MHHEARIATRALRCFARRPASWPSFLASEPVLQCVASRGRSLSVVLTSCSTGSSCANNCSDVALADFVCRRKCQTRWSTTLSLELAAGDEAFEQTETAGAAVHQSALIPKDRGGAMPGGNCVNELGDVHSDRFDGEFPVLRMRAEPATALIDMNAGERALNWPSAIPTLMRRSGASCESQRESAARAPCPQRLGRP